MELSDILMGFCTLKDSPFPEHLCTQPNVDESSVMDSSEDCYYLVLILDKRFECNARLSKMKPYLYREGKEIFYGWVDCEGNFVDHGESAIHANEHFSVVAWKPCIKDFDLRQAR